MTSVISPVLFYLMAAVIIFAGIGMVISTNLFHSAMFMLLCFVGVAGLYGTLQEGFLAVVQIMVYVGAITILLIFGIMLTRGYGHRDRTNPFSKTVIGGAVVSLSLCAVVSLGIRTIEFIPATPILTEAVYHIGIHLFGIYILPTELAALLLLLAMIGAVIIAREGERE